ncbi:GIY-YIG nuclease family protein [Lacinutrix sp. C3R15]|uniref:GIY-YIG nuclease family protein n=1 Tax=Flavobacteriaceae TaxID=49546 RepID=UPI001C0A0EB0|nr:MULTISPECIES: GIY-YIG nuclease family protein [Flavobacteriaceae]MBU2939850.1 GIY-YIG nuclease family protein [Lacinutrix sp. C3R15]MDO6623166.1 GIY-YIG nuclease family protein [Oceanihabitans sp. 1_MG-2023]
MSKKKPTLDDIFNDDEFGLLDSKAKTSTVKTEEDRLIDSFEEINIFIDKNDREPSTSSMSEYGLLAKLKNFRQDDAKKKIVKPFDRHNLLGYVEMEKPSLDDILNDDDLGLLDTDEDLSIFTFKHTPKQEDRAETDFVAQRKPLKEKDFKPYEGMFQKVHKDIKEGKREIKPFKNIEKNLHIGNYYIMDGILLYLESADLERTEWEQSSGNRVRIEGRTRTIFENGTYSNMLYRSLGKQIQKNGKLITNSNDYAENELFVNSGLVKEEDVQTGWIYVLKSKSIDPKISGIKDLYKIGFSSISVDDRIKNAKKEATYLYADVKKIASYNVYNRNADKLELLLHKFFASTCLDIEFTNDKGQRINPREWFVVPFEIIDEAIQLILNGNIVNYTFDVESMSIKLKYN